MSDTFTGTLSGSAAGKVRIRLVADSADMSAGGEGRGGDLQLLNDAGVVKVHLDAGGAEGPGRPKLATAEIYVRGDGLVRAGGHGHAGKVDLRNAGNKQAVSLGGGETGDLYLRNAAGEFTLALRAVEGNMAGIWVGGNGQNGHIVIRAADGSNAIHLDGDAGDIVLSNADCAEEFEIGEDADVRPGTVMAICEDSLLRPTSRPYDRCVAGIVSGAGAFRPAIVLGRNASGGRRTPIALAGRVACRVDAREVPIEVGDLLTTSAEPGLAMKATDPARAFGAVIGKALAGLEGATGTVPVLVALQ